MILYISLCFILVVLGEYSVYSFLLSARLIVTGLSRKFMGAHLHP